MNDNSESNNLDLRDWWAIIVRRRWWLLGPLFLFGWLGFATAQKWPYVYRSEALVLVEPQKVPEQYVMPNIVSDLGVRLQSITQQVLSRTRLGRLIEQFNLYPLERAHRIMEDVVNRMRDDIRVEPVETRGRPGEFTAFRISYSAKDPHVAQQITSELTSLFIEENSETRTQQSAGTTTFLENELEQARKDLANQEQRQREYKLRYLGELPEQQQANLQILSSLEAQLYSASDSLNRAEQQKIYLESMRDQYRAMQKSMRTVTGDVRIGPVATVDAALSDLHRELVRLQGRYTPQHPDVIKLKENIAQWEVLKQRAEVDQASSPKADASVSSATTDPALVDVESRLKSLALELQDRQKEIDALRGRIREFQSRLSLTPVREQQLADVTRAYENSRQYYQSLLQKKLQSELATNLEKHQQGEQFRIIDLASLPTKPEPNRLKIILIGWGLGFAVGVALVALFEFSDETIRSEKAVVDSVKLPVLVRIPVLNTPGEQIRERWYRGLEVVALALLIILSVGTSLYTRLVN